MSNSTCYLRNWDIILNRVKDYYVNDKEILREHARDKSRNFSIEEEKNKKKEYGKNRYQSKSGEKNKD